MSEAEPVPRLEELLVRDGELVDEVGAALRATCLLVVRAACGRGARELFREVRGGMMLRERTNQTQHACGEDPEPGGDVVALHRRNVRTRPDTQTQKFGNSKTG